MAYEPRIKTCRIIERKNEKREPVYLLDPEPVAVVWFRAFGEHAFLLTLRQGTLHWVTSDTVHTSNTNTQR
jgi:hypothetical protein